MKRIVRPGLVALGVVLAAGVLGIIAGGYIYGWSWTGLRAKTFWDWTQLLVIPLVLAAGGYVFKSQQDKRHEEATAQAAAQLQHETTSETYQQAQWQTYLEHMSDLLLNHKLATSERDPEAHLVARVRTLTATRQLSGGWVGLMLQFLSESGLILGDDPVISLAGANLDTATLSNADLHGADLRATSLRGAILTTVDLHGADLRGADLSGFSLAWVPPATLSAVDLSGAKLNGTILSGVTLQAVNLNGAHLDGAQLSGAVLKGVTLTDATLTEADLSGASMDTSDLREQDQKAISTMDVLAPLKETLLGVDLTGADLTRADLSRATLSAVTLTEANFAEANLCGADLSQTKGQPKSFAGAQYDKATRWPPGVRPDAVGAVRSKS